MRSLPKRQILCVCVRGWEKTIGKKNIRCKSRENKKIKIRKLLGI